MKIFARLFDTKPQPFRALMQNYGTEVRRRDNADYWVNIWKDSVSGALKDKKHVVADDVRFLNEAKAVKDAGGILVKLMREDIQTTGNHVSETEQDNIKCDVEIKLIKNDFNALEKDLKRIAEEFNLKSHAS